MKITLRFNILMTFALLGIGLLMFPFKAEHSEPLRIQKFFPDSPLLFFTLGVIGAVLLVASEMYFIRAIWNRLLPQLCGWRQISLAEAYALSLLVGVLWMH